MKLNSSPLLRPFVLVAVVASLFACSGGAGANEQVACPAATGPAANRYSGLPLGKGADGIEFRAFAPKVAGTTALTSLGELCKTAKSRDACLEKVDVTRRLGQTRGWNTGTDDGGASAALHYGIATLGDEVFVVDGPEALAKALAPIDKAETAVAIIKLTADPTVVCGGPNVTREENRMLVHAHSDYCGNQYDTVYTVTGDGRVEKGERRLTVESGLDCN